MISAVLLTAACLLAIPAYRRWFVPNCPRCRAKDWDRKLCAPLLFCRRCSTRVDHSLRTYN